MSLHFNQSKQRMLWQYVVILLLLFPCLKMDVKATDVDEVVVCRWSRSGGGSMYERDNQVVNYDYHQQYITFYFSPDSPSGTYGFSLYESASTSFDLNIQISGGKIQNKEQLATYSRVLGITDQRLWIKFHNAPTNTAGGQVWMQYIGGPATAEINRLSYVWKTELQEVWRTYDPQFGEQFHLWSLSHLEERTPDIQISNNATFIIGGHCLRQDLFPGCPTSKPMASYQFSSMRAGLVVSDTPIGYDSPLGARPEVKITYHNQELSDPTFALTTHYGSGWSSPISAFVQGGPANKTASAVSYSHGWGDEYYYYFVESQNPNGTPNLNHFVSLPGTRTQAVLHYKIENNQDHYERIFPDGTREIYGKKVVREDLLGENSTSYGLSTPIYFLTQIVDAQGNVLEVLYDETPNVARISGLRDALGQTTTLTYGDSSRFMSPTQITDPFGRSAQLTYTQEGNLQSITDPAGILSQFAYDSTSGRMKSMTTPYGTTAFTYLDNGVEATEPDGSKTRIEYHASISSSLVPASESSIPSASGLVIDNQELNKKVSFYWDRKAMAEASKSGVLPGTAAFYGRAVQTRWLASPDGTSAYPSSIKGPLKNRVWFNYLDSKNQFVSSKMDDNSGLLKPVAQATVLPDNTTQISRTTYNSYGKVVKQIDPLGRSTEYDYAVNGVDLAAIRQTTGSINETLLQITSYNTAHQPLTVIDASGQTWSYSYTDEFQLETVTNPKNETTTYRYFSDFYLKEIDGPASGSNDKVSYTWLDGLPRTVADSEGYSVTLDYDNIQRLSKITYPDNTTDETIYSALKPRWHKDRLNRWTQYWFNSQQELVASMDPLLRMNYLEWCRCGSLSKLRDANGNITQWKYNHANQLVEKTYANGKRDAYTYDSIGRLHTTTDALDQVKTLNYFADNRLKEVLYTASVNATPNLSFTYDADYGRLATVTDGTGTATYSYRAIGTQGALKLAGIDHVAATGFSSYSISRTYDELGRLLNQTTGGEANTSLAANSTTYAYDDLGRVDSVTDPLGLFDLNYVNATQRLQSLVYPAAGIQTNFGYHSNTNDQRLEEIENRINGGAVFSKFNYGYDKMGNITTWTRQAGSGTPDVWVNRYDAADQLSDVRQVVTGPPLALQKNWVFHYDPAGNRTSEQVDQTVNQSAYNNLSQLTSRSGGGQLQVEGEINEPGTVTIQSQAMTNSQPATVDANGVFTGKATVTPGSNTLTIVATDASGNARTRQYGVTVDGLTASQSFGYDDNGNMRNRPGTIYHWDAENRLIKIEYAGEGQTEFSYDGFSRRVKAVEKNAGGTITSEKRWIWSGGAQPCEERDAANKVTKRYFGYGLQTVDATDVTTNFFTMRDHLGSVRELVDSTGAVRARYDYDPFGRRTKTSGDLNTDFGYTGHYFHERSGLNLALYRAYDAELGRWLSRDPIAESGGINLYGYVGNDPIRNVDPFGKLKLNVIENDAEMADYARLIGGEPPDYPGGENVDRNISNAEAHSIWNPLNRGPWWFRDQVKNKGPWDYKQRGGQGQYERCGNFNYGATGRGAGFNEDFLRRQAGKAQKAAGTSKPEWDKPPYYGDDPDDSFWIGQGIQYYERSHNK